MTDIGSVFSRARKEEVITAVSELTKLIGKDGWFISGSFAHPDITDHRDVDIFFYTEEAFHKANTLLDIEINKTPPGGSLFDSFSNSYSTENAISYNHLLKAAPNIQLIKCNFGTVADIFDTFDLNVCKKAILPDFSHITGKMSTAELYICKPSYDTFARVIKYAYRLYDYKEVTIILRKIINQYIDKDEIITGYYGGEIKSGPTNVCLYNSFRALTDQTIQTYLTFKTKKHAPELLI
jgi:hypothetical protein